MSTDLLALASPVTPIYLDEQPDGRFLIRCPDCGWHRAFGREQNAITSLSEHSLAAHRIRRIWPNYVRSGA